MLSTLYVKSTKILQISPEKLFMFKLAKPTFSPLTACAHGNLVLQCTSSIFLEYYNFKIYTTYFNTDIPMSVGVIDIKTNPSQLNAVEFLWDPTKCTSAFIQV